MLYDGETTFDMPVSDNSVITDKHKKNTTLANDLSRTVFGCLAALLTTMILWWVIMYVYIVVL